MNLVTVVTEYYGRLSWLQCDGGRDGTIQYIRQLLYYVLDDILFFLVLNVSGNKRKNARGDELFRVCRVRIASLGFTQMLL